MAAIKAMACVLLAGAVLVQGGIAPGSGPTETARWRWPTSPPGAVTRAFEAPANPYAAGHRGIDVAASPGQTVLAPADAVLQFAGVVVDRPVVTLRIDEHVLLSIEPVATELPVGAAVSTGVPIGTVAAGGHCDGSCLHVGVRVDGQYVSPLLFFAGVPPAVLLPLD